MKSYRAFAWKELLAQKVIATLILIAVILSTIMTTVIGQSIGILSVMRVQQAAYLNGNRYATFHGLTPQQAERLTSDSRLAYSGQMLFIGLSDIPNSSFSMQLREYTGNSLSAYESISQIESGRLPKNPGEIALPQDYLSMIGYEGKIGDTISLDMRVSLLRDTAAVHSYSHDFILTGILKPNYLGYVTGIMSGIAGAGTAEILLPEKYMLYSVDIRTADKNTFQTTMDNLARELSISEEQTQYNDTMLSALGIAYRSTDSADPTQGFSFVIVSGILIGALVLFAAGLVIYNILKIAVTKRITEYGMLRAIGAERGKLCTLVSIQLAILCGIGIPIGTILGSLSARGILTAATSIFSPEIFMASTQNEVAALVAASDGGILPLLISATITLLFAYIAAMPAAWYAAKVSPVTAMTGVTANIKRKSRKTGRIRNFEAFYARMNLKRNRGRTAITVLSLVMSITVFIALQSFAGLLDVSSSIPNERPGDYAITNEAVGFSPDMVDELKATAGISSVSTLKHSLFTFDTNGNMAGIDTSLSLQTHETLLIAGLDEERLQSLLPSVSQRDLSDLRVGAACLVKNPITISFGDEAFSFTEVNIGDMITINGLSLRVVGVVNDPIRLDGSGFANGVQIIVNDMSHEKITGQSNYTELYPVLSQGTDRAAIERVIAELCKQTGGSRFVSYENLDKQLRESYEQINLLAWGLILFIGLIGVLNIINTVYTNIHTRIMEIGVQRAIGMSMGGLYKTFLWEGAYYGIFAAVIGGIAGYICTVFVSAATTENLQLVAVPISTILEAAACSVAACLIATCIPLRQIASRSIVTSIRAVE